MSDNVIQLVHENNTMETKGEVARGLVVQFLREWADAIEKGEEVAEKAVLILHDEQVDGDRSLFCTKIRRCNTTLIEQVGIMQIAITDLCSGTALD